jgi:large subunit ribosomal protein L10
VPRRKIKLLLALLGECFFNAMKKTEKSLFVQNLTEELKSVNSAILINYSGLDVSMQQDLKKRLKEVGARMLVVKNTLLKIAGEKAKIEDEMLKDTVLEGQNALILAEDDPIAPLQVLAKFAGEFETPQIKVGLVEGSFQDKDALDNLSKLPGKDALLVQALGAIAAPTYSIVSVLQNNLNQLVLVLDEASKKAK